jgi:hypothetical protein
MYYRSLLTIKHLVITSIHLVYFGSLAVECETPKIWSALEANHTWFIAQVEMLVFLFILKAFDNIKTNENPTRTTQRIVISAIAIAKFESKSTTLSYHST